MHIFDSPVNWIYAYLLDFRVKWTFYIYLLDTRVNLTFVYFLAVWQVGPMFILLILFLPFYSNANRTTFLYYCEPYLLIF